MPFDNCLLLQGNYRYQSQNHEKVFRKCIDFSYFPINYFTTVFVIWKFWLKFIFRTKYTFKLNMFGFSLKCFIQSQLRKFHLRKTWNFSNCFVIRKSLARLEKDFDGRESILIFLKLQDCSWYALKRTSIAESQSCSGSNRKLLTSSLNGALYIPFSMQTSKNSTADYFSYSFSSSSHPIRWHCVCAIIGNAHWV